MKAPTIVRILIRPNHPLMLTNTITSETNNKITDKKKSMSEFTARFTSSCLGFIQANPKKTVHKTNNRVSIAREKIKNVYKFTEKLSIITFENRSCLSRSNKNPAKVKLPKNAEISGKV